MSKIKSGVNFDQYSYRYSRASKAGKSKILDELCDLYGYNRKYLLQVFNLLTGKKHVMLGRQDGLRTQKTSALVKVCMAGYRSDVQQEIESCHTPSLSIKGAMYRYLKPSCDNS